MRPRPSQLRWMYQNRAARAVGSRSVRLLRSWGPELLLWCCWALLGAAAGRLL